MSWLRATGSAGVCPRTGGASGTQTGIRHFILNTKTAWNRLVLVRESELHAIAWGAGLRQSHRGSTGLYEMGLYGARAGVLVGDPVTYPFSPYLASLVASEPPDDLAPGFLMKRNMFRTLPSC
jgi:hypothetical protein